MRRLVVVALLMSMASAGCLDSTFDASSDPLGTAAWTPCEHPWPCGDGSEWPVDVPGPFERLPPLRVQVPSFDGVLMDGAIWLPDVPEGTALPVVLYTSPYIGQCSYQSISRQSPSCLGSPESEARLNGYGFAGMIEEGYAVAIFSVRGSGASGGCYDSWGPAEQQDQAELVTWLAEQPWSNGRVGMVGLSYSGTTPWEAAILAPEALKAIVVGGIITDVYLGMFTPQGAAMRGGLNFHAGTVAANSLVPPAVGGPLTMLPTYAPQSHERACPEAARGLSVHQRSALTDERDAEWFGDRRLVDRFADVKAAPLVLHGFQDNSFHRHQQDIIWDALPNAPKGSVLGQWNHTTFLDDHLQNYDGGSSWYGLQLAWFDFFLKGLGDPPAQLGRVAYQVSSGEWMDETAWPPTQASDEVLYLSGDALDTDPGDGARALALAPILDNSRDCTDDPPTSGAPPQVIYATQPATRDVVLAGNPYGVLTVSADKPRGIFGVELLVVGPDWDCTKGGDVRRITFGGADLRFHAGNMQGQDFPVNTPTTMRFDLTNAAERIAEGQRLVLILRNGDDFAGQHDDTTLTVHGDSHIVLPIVEGTFGGAAPTVEAPPRPFVPGA